VRGLVQSAASFGATLREWRRSKAAKGSSESPAAHLSVHEGVVAGQHLVESVAACDEGWGLGFRVEGGGLGVWGVGGVGWVEGWVEGVGLYGVRSCSWAQRETQ